MAELIERLSLSSRGRVPASGTEFTALDVKTTGLHTGRVLEVAAIRFRGDGTFLGEFATVVAADASRRNPHRITAAELADAPALSGILGRLFELCQGAVLVAHDLSSVEGLLTEIGQLGVRLPRLPAISLKDTAQAALPLPNYRLATIARAFGIEDFPGYLAEPAARACAQAMLALVGTHGLRLAQPVRFPELPWYAGNAATLRRTVAGAETGWMAEAVDRVPAGAWGPVAQAYLDLLAEAVGDQFLTDEEVWALADLAAEAGMAAAEVQRIHTGFIAELRRVAEADGVVTSAEYRELRQVADALGALEVVVDLKVTATGDKPTRVLVLGTTADADQLRARVLSEGFQLAKNLTGSVTHLAYDSGVRDSEPRLSRALELGAHVARLDEAAVLLGFAPAPQPRHQKAPSSSGHLVGRVLMGLGLVLMVLTVAAMFGGAGLGPGIVLAVFAVGALVGGWYLDETKRATAGSAG
ncbi:DNA polymerase III subunit epsilon [Amycolatopsis sp. AA4]|uniref:3'-5' exonuclease n=1 Tax=Actinomycetes TaxID=1760 RepID=UPI0001B535E1|nr:MULTISPECIES: DNA polymerase III subunit epsilon [Actinomycetes]ATY15909.1 DNA polymerase III subunit epsilon [Amycolatopsis sp. AA4]